MDSPCRVTRSQVKRISNAHVNPPSPKPVTSRRRSSKVQETGRDSNNQQEISPTEARGSKAVKGVHNTRRMSKMFSSLESESGKDAISTQGSVLESIDEQSKPITRRTRSSMKHVTEIDSELPLPKLRRTRKSSVCSVASTSTVESSIASPMRRTRGRRNLSPVPSVSASEVSTLSEIQEVSPNSMKRRSSQDDCLSSSSPRRSSNSSPAISSTKSPTQAPPGSGISPTSVKGGTSVTTPRQLWFNEPDPVSTAPAGSKRLSTISLQSDDQKSVESPELLNLSVTNRKSRRRSSGRLSLSSTSKFVETPLHASPVPQSEESLNDSVDSGGKKSLGASSNSRKSFRMSAGRLSLSSNKSSPAKFPQFNESPMNDSPRKNNLREKKSNSDEKKESDFYSPLKSQDCPQVSHRKPSPAKLPNFEETPLNDSPQETQQGKKGSPDIENNESKFVSPGETMKTDSDSHTPLKTEGRSQASRRSSNGRLSLSSHKPSPPKFSKFEETPLNDSPKKIQLATEESSDVEIEDSNTMKTANTPQNSHRSSSGRLSMSSSTLSPADFENSSINGKTIQLHERKSADSLGSETSVDSPLPVIQQISQKSHRGSSGRLSLSSLKSYHAKSSDFVESPLNELPKKIQPDQESTGNTESRTSEPGSPESKQMIECLIPPLMPESTDKSASSAMQQSANRQSLNSSLPSTTPTKDFLKSEEHKSVSLIELEDSDEIHSKESSEKSSRATSFISKGSRASTGRLSIEKSKELGGVAKCRASFSSAIDVDVNHLETAFESKSSPNMLLQTDNSEVNIKNNFEDDEPDHSSSDKKEPPDAKLESSLDSHFELKVNSSVNSQVSSNSKNSLNDEQECVIDCGLLYNPVLSKEKSSVAKSKKLAEEVNDSVEYSEQPDTRSRISHKDVAGNVLKDAAYLLSGGDVYDPDDSGSDDNQWQLVFSPSTKSKKEKRLEKKAKKRAEKEARKKTKVETSNISADQANQISEARHLTQSETKVRENSLHQNEEVCDDSTFETQVVDKNLDCVIGSPKKNEKRDSIQLTAVTDSSAPALQIDSSVHLDVNHLESRNKTDETIIKKKKKKNKKRKHIEEHESVSEISRHQGNELIDSELEVVAKKRKKCVDADLSTMQKRVGFSDVSDIPSSGHDDDIKKKKKKKKGKKGKKTMSSEVSNPTDLKNAADAEFTDLGGNLLKKICKTKALASNSEMNSDVSGPSTSINAENTLKKKKKKKSSLEVVDSENVKDDSELNRNVKKTSKQKKGKAKLMVEEAILKSELNDKAIKKKHKKQLQPSAIKEVIMNNGSDSDEAPASVSFAAGRQAALAELQAAAECIRKQNEKKREKLRLKQEKMKEEKLAKIQKLKKKRREAAANSISSQNDSQAATSQMYIQKSHDLQIASSSVKPPKRLPADLLESLSEQPPSKLIKRPDGSKERVAGAALSKEELERLEKKRSKKLALKLKEKKLRESDYIPLEGVLGSTRFGVVPLRNIMLAKKLAKNKLAEEATNFRKENLFGNRIRRTPISAYLAHQEKLKVSGKDQLVGHRSN